MELEIMHDFNANRLVIYLWEEMKGHGMRFYSYNGEHLEVTEVEDPVSRSTPEAKPLLILPLHLGKKMLELLAKELSKQGIQTANENLLQGKLLSTEKHLEDMRELVKQWSQQLKPADPELTKMWMEFIANKNHS